MLSLFVRSRLSVENPGKLQILLEDGLRALLGMMEQWIGPKGPRYFPLVGTLFVFILVSNYLGLVPGFMAPTSSLNVTLGCALTIWVYYHFQGFKEQGVVNYLKHFAMPPGSPVWMAPLMLIIEIISHLARVMSLSLRLFGNIFGEELVILIFFSLVPFRAPAADDVPRADHRRSAGIHLRAAVDHLPAGRCRCRARPRRPRSRRAATGTMLRRPHDRRSSVGVSAGSSTTRSFLSGGLDRE